MIDIQDPCLFRWFQKAFDSSPHVLVTSEHSRPDLKHDAASTWVEGIKMNAFKVCLREMQNFDGQHKNILVVRNAAVAKYRYNETITRRKVSVLKNVRNLKFRARTGQNIIWTVSHSSPFKDSSHKKRKS